MYILGINGNIGRASHDPSATILKNGEIVFAAEEERYNGIKHSTGYIPILAIKNGLKFLNINIKDISYLAIPQETWGDLFENRIINIFYHWFGYCPPIKKFNHHLSHAASAYYSSGFKDEAIVYSIDGSGDSVSLSSYLFHKDRYKEIMIKKFPNSMGLFYSLITQYLGFYKNSDEYKLMSLSALGNPRYNLNDVISFNPSTGLRLNEKFLSEQAKNLRYPYYATSQEPFYSHEFEKYCKRRLPGSKIDQSHKDLAASAQKHFEDINISIIKELINKTKCKNIIISGGSMLNCKLVGEIIKNINPTYFYISPFSDDCGTSVGASMLASIDLGVYPSKLKNAFLGNEFEDEYIKNVLMKNKIDYQQLNYTERYERLSHDIYNNLIVANFNHRMEFGPRALGNRSILANANREGIRNKLNLLKKRYDFQPFAVAILEEYTEKYFYNYNIQSPYMNIAFKVRESMKNNLKHVIHYDDTVRVQTVDEESSELKLIIEKLMELYNIPYIVNTSFNMKGKPIISNPEEALAMFYATEIDVLYIGNFRISKLGDN